MEKILFLASLTFVISAKAQQYVPFPDSNAYWNEFYSNYGFPDYKYTYFIRGDTIIDTLTYHKIYSDDSTSTIRYIGGLREYNKQIYFGGCGNKVILYNFNVGDSMELPCNFCDTSTKLYAKVTSVDSVLLTNLNLYLSG
jgi:hypothetical protein